MPEFERSETIDASVVETYRFVADPRNLPKYVATMVMAEPRSKGMLRVAADVSGRHEEGDARFKGDEQRHRIEWGGTANGYSGWLQVDPGQEGDRARITIHLTTATDDERDEIEQALDETLDRIKGELRGGR